MASDEDDFYATAHHKKRKPLPANTGAKDKYAHRRKGSAPLSSFHARRLSHGICQPPNLTAFFQPKYDSTFIQEEGGREHTASMGSRINELSCHPSSTTPSSNLSAHCAVKMTEDGLRQELGVTGLVNDSYKGALDTDTSDSETDQLSDLAVSEAGDDACEIIDLVSDDEELQECEGGVRDLTIASVPRMTISTSEVQAGDFANVVVKQEQESFDSPGSSVAFHDMGLLESNVDAKRERDSCSFGAPQLLPPVEPHVTINQVTISTW
jgi:ribosomal protein L14